MLAFLVGPEAVTNGEIISAASDREQAAIIYKYCKQMIELDDELSQMCACFDSNKRIVCYHNGSFYRALSADARRQHGGIPIFAVYDELAQAKDRELYDVIATAFGAADEGLYAVISTQSDDPQHIMSELCDEAEAIERGEIEDPTFYGKVYSVPIGDEKNPVSIYDEKNWYLANPALGKFKSLEHMRSLALKARRSPAAEAAFRSLELNQRVSGVERLVNSADWRACARQVDESEYKHRPCFGGLDLSSRLDLTALTLTWSLDKGRTYTRSWFWTHETDLDDRAKLDGAHYKVWADQGWLRVLPGRSIDYSAVVSDVALIVAQYQLGALAFDRWRMDEFKKSATDAGIDLGLLKLAEYGQGFKDHTVAIEQIEERVVAHTLAHDGNPVLSYCLSNVRVQRDAAGNRKFDKRKKNMRIDGAVTLGMSLGVLSKTIKEGSESVYETDDFLI